MSEVLMRGTFEIYHISKVGQNGEVILRPLGVGAGGERRIVILHKGARAPKWEISTRKTGAYATMKVDWYPVMIREDQTLGLCDAPGSDMWNISPAPSLPPPMADSLYTVRSVGGKAWSFPRDVSQGEEPIVLSNVASIFYFKSITSNVAADNE
ncbi:hypothetical protein CVT24_007458 [Panaeolus cyanescens]|uniref:Uncharacterized protein n=1 Tax=Panaeolus cyanescens TaxID=181874 RepID=A0A409WLF6_9AGAR|nr:hypothetical protein CVT24_007458 [Panaeolus cyanescens]